jgi:hypothetical protein
LSIFGVHKNVASIIFGLILLYALIGLVAAFISFIFGDTKITLDNLHDSPKLLAGLPWILKPAFFFSMLLPLFSAILFFRYAFKVLSKSFTGVKHLAGFFLAFGCIFLMVFGFLSYNNAVASLPTVAKALTSIVPTGTMFWDDSDNGEQAQKTEDDVTPSAATPPVAVETTPPVTTPPATEAALPVEAPPVAEATPPVTTPPVTEAVAPVATSPEATLPIDNTASETTGANETQAEAPGTITPTETPPVETVLEDNPLTTTDGDTEVVGFPPNVDVGTSLGTGSVVYLNGSTQSESVALGTETPAERAVEDTPAEQRVETSEVTPEAEADSRALREDVTKLSDLHSNLSSQQDQQRYDLNQHDQRLQDLAGENQSLWIQFEEHTSTLAQQDKTIQDLISRNNELQATAASNAALIKDQDEKIKQLSSENALLRSDSQANLSRIKANQEQLEGLSKVTTQQNQTDQLHLSRIQELENQVRELLKRLESQQDAASTGNASQ